MPDLLPISVIIMTRNNDDTLERCLSSLSNFDDIHIVDSHSSDDTLDIAKRYNTQITAFDWNGQYPKKKQWCLENLTLTYDWVLYLDADEALTPSFTRHLKHLVPSAITEGYFIKAKHVIGNKTLHFGLLNSKLALFRKSTFYYPVIDDLSAPGSFEVEGHYQPIPKKDVSIGIIHEPILHFNTDNIEHYKAQHETYSAWEAHMIKNNLYPDDPNMLRQWLKIFIRKNPLRPFLIFIYSYIFKLGFLDSKEGVLYAKLKADYASNVLALLKERKRQ